jgi:hypothetical protein
LCNSLPDVRSTKVTLSAVKQGKALLIQDVDVARLIETSRKIGLL